MSSSIEKYLLGAKTTGNEKREVLFCILYALSEVNPLHFDIIEDWFTDSISKQKEELLRFSSGYRCSALRSFLNIIKSEEQFEFIDHEELFEFYTSFNTKKELLSFLKITPRKIDDLFVSIDFNISKNEHFHQGLLSNSIKCFNDDRLITNLIKIRKEIANNI